MIYLVFSILCSSSLLVFFKLFEKYKVEAPQAIAVNYIVASVIGFLFLDDDFQLTRQDLNWYLIASGLGCLFAIVFNLSRYTTEKLGMGITGVAMKLGVILPVLMGIVFYHESFKFINYFGILLGIGSLFLLTKFEKSGSHYPISNYILLLPLLVWIGSGVCDGSVQLAHKLYSHAAESGGFAFIAFWSAGTLSLLYVILNNKIWNFKILIGGILLGIPNYFSIYFLVKCLKSMKDAYNLSSSNIFMINNLSVVILSIGIGVLLFKERLTKYNFFGIGIALLALVLISR